MRNVEFTDEQIIDAGEALQADGVTITSFSLRNRVGGGNPARLKKVWDDYVATRGALQVQETAELDADIVAAVQGYTQSLDAQLLALASKINENAIKSANRRVEDVLEALDKQKKQFETELSDAHKSVLKAEAAEDSAKNETADLLQQLVHINEQGQKQAQELAQLRERLTLAAQTTEAEKLRTQNEADALRAECTEARQDATRAREFAARLDGKVEALESQRDEMIKALSERAEIDKAAPAVNSKKT